MEGKTGYEIAKEIFPEASDAVIEAIIWEHTGFPGFWKLEDGPTPEARFRKHLENYKRTVKPTGQERTD